MDRPSPLSPVEIYVRLRDRGFFRPDGSLDRNATKNAMIEWSWIRWADMCDQMAKSLCEMDALSPSLRKELGEGYLRAYMRSLMHRYM